MLDDYTLCNRYNCLPEAGGLYDQDAELMAKFRIIDQIMTKKRDFEQRKQEMAQRAKEQAPPGGL